MSEAIEKEKSVLVIGSARCGKTTLARNISNLTGRLFVPSDPSISALKRIPELHTHFGGIDDQQQPYSEWIKRIKERDDFLASYLLDLVSETVQRLETSTAFEGPLWPRHLGRLTIPYHAIVLVDTSENAAERLQKIATSSVFSSENWQANWPAERIAKWAEYNRQRSIEYREEATRVDLPLIDLADYSTIQESSTAALGALGLD